MGSREKSKKHWSRVYPHLDGCRNPLCQARHKPHYALGYCHTCWLLQWWHRRKREWGMTEYRRWERDRKREWRARLPGTNPGNEKTVEA